MYYSVNRLGSKCNWNHLSYPIWSFAEVFNPDEKNHLLIIKSSPASYGHWNTGPLTAVSPIAFMKAFFLQIAF